MKLKTGIELISLLELLLLPQLLASLFNYRGMNEQLNGIQEVISSILNSQPYSWSSAVIIVDETDFSETTYHQLWAPYGVSTFIIKTSGTESESMSEMIHTTVSLASKHRKFSWDATIIIISKNPEFLSILAEASLKFRLLKSSTKVIVVTRLQEKSLKQLMASHWSFSMMNTMFINVIKGFPELSCKMFVHLPYSPEGPTLREVERWSFDQGFLQNRENVFPLKFNNFFGAKVNVTARDYKPVWYTSKETLSNGTVVPKLMGMDYLLLEAISQVLNFSINVIYIGTWGEGLDKVTERTSFITPAYHAILEDRVKRFDFTFGFAYVRITFSMAKPLITPNWLSLYRPLSNEVWASILVVLMCMPIMLLTITRPEFLNEEMKGRSFGWISQVTFGSLLGQALGNRLPISNACRVFMASWFIFAFIVTTGYRGNLTASLTLPSYPPRAETIKQLVDSADRITMAPWGKDYKTSFKNSGIQVMEKLSDLMLIGPRLKEGLRQSLEDKQGHLDTLVSIQVGIMEHFTHNDGTSRFYLGRESVFPGLSGWPIPHDAPFKSNLDWCISAAVEGGLYSKWNDDMLGLTRQETLRKKREFSQNQLEAESSTVEEDDQSDKDENEKALSLAHMQGPLMLFVTGVTLGSLIFFIEIASTWKGKHSA